MMDQLYARHDLEIKELKETSKQMLKSAKKSEKAVIESRIIQLEFDLKAKHREEEDELENQLGMMRLLVRLLEL